MGLDLTGGWYDAGDHVKFNFPMAWSATTLAWGVHEYWDAWQKAGELNHALDNIKWVTDYLIKCHPDKDTYYVQVRPRAKSKAVHWIQWPNGMSKPKAHHTFIT